MAGNFFWWLKQGICILLGCIFLAFGIHMLIAAYYLKDPFSFVMTFFASNLVILISATLLFIFFRQIRRLFKRPPREP